jgi:periplasmic protein TonB
VRAAVLRTSIAARAAALAASAIVHATAFVVAPGHTRENGIESIERTVEVLVDVSDDEPAPSAAPDPRAPDASPRSHRHPVMLSHDGMPHDPAPVHVRAGVAAAEAAEAQVITASPSPPVPRFTIVVGGGLHAGDGAVAARERSGGLGDPEPIAADRATTPARMLAGASPEYPPEARAQGIEANVVLEIVVDTAGRVRTARVARSATARFDGAALTAVRGYRFVPATLDGRPVSVRMRWSVDFQLQ